MRAGQLELRARLVAITLGPIDLALDQQDPAPHGRREVAAQQLLDDRANVGAASTIDRALHQTQLQRHRQRRAARLERRGSIARRRPSLRCRAAPGPVRPRPTRARRRRGGAARDSAERRHRVRRCGRPPVVHHASRSCAVESSGCGPPSTKRLSSSAARDGVAGASERFALPEDDVARQRPPAACAAAAGRTPPGRPRDGRGRSCASPRPKLAPGIERHRDRPRQQRGEGVARARGVTHAQGRPAAAVERPRSELLARILGDLTE